MSKNRSYLQIIGNIANNGYNNINPIPNSNPNSSTPYKNEKSLYESKNGGGGYSFDQHKAIKKALAENDTVNARKMGYEYLLKIATIGTDDNYVNCNNTVLSDKIINFCNLMIKFGLSDLIVDTVREVYFGNRAKKLDYSIYLLSLCTTVSDDISGSPSNTSNIRNYAYTFVPSFRTFSHFLQWISTHMAICRKKGNNGNGSGFRKACINWFNKNSYTPLELQYQLIKYGNRSGYTVKDVLSLIHIKPTSKKINSNNSDNSNNIRDYLSIGTQFVLACSVKGLERAVSELDNIIERKLLSIEKSPYKKNEIYEEIFEALECLAYAGSVQIAKSSKSTISDIVEQINCFGLTHEMINNDFMKEQSVLIALASRTIPSKRLIYDVKFRIINNLCKNTLNVSNAVSAFSAKITEIIENEIKQKYIINDLCNKIYNPEKDISAILSTEIRNIIESESNIKSDNPQDNYTQYDNYTGSDNTGSDNTESEINPRKITMPYNACTRFLSRLTIAGLFDRASYPEAPKMTDMICDFLVDPKIVERSRIHPFSLFTTLIAYRSGGLALSENNRNNISNIKTSLAWKPVTSLVESLEKAIRVSYQNCEPHNKITAHLIDASASMSWPTSTTIPGVTARDIVTFMVAVSMHIENISEHPERFYAGYFGLRSLDPCNFIDITQQLTQNISYASLREFLPNLSGGVTNIQTGFDYYKNMLQRSLNSALDGDKKFSHIKSAIQLPGFIELFQLWTDNDINSGKKVPDCLDEYHLVQKSACFAYPRDFDGVNVGEYVDPESLFQKYSAKIIIVCTLSTEHVVGDPFDKRILCVSCFDSSGPQVISNFLKDFDKSIKN